MAVMLWRENNRARWVGTRPGHDGEQVIATGDVSNGIAILHTVTAGKTLYIVSAFLTSTVVLVPNNHGVYIRDDADALWKYLCYLNKSVAGDLVWSISYPIPLEIPEGYDVCVQAAGAGNRSYGGITGWEE